MSLPAKFTHELFNYINTEVSLSYAFCDDSNHSYINNLFDAILIHDAKILIPILEYERASKNYDMIKEIVQLEWSRAITPEYDRTYLEVLLSSNSIFIVCIWDELKENKEKFNEFITLIFQEHDVYDPHTQSNKRVSIVISMIGHLFEDICNNYVYYQNNPRLIEMLCTLWHTIWQYNTVCIEPIQQKKNKIFGNTTLFLCIELHITFIIEKLLQYEEKKEEIIL